MKEVENLVGKWQEEQTLLDMVNLLQLLIYGLGKAVWKMVKQLGILEIYTQFQQKTL